MKGKDGTSQYSALQYKSLHCNTIKGFALKSIIPKIFLFIISNMSYLNLTNCKGSGKNTSVVSCVVYISN